jgi:hypothetical protein
MKNLHRKFLGWLIVVVFSAAASATSVTQIARFTATGTPEGNIFGASVAIDQDTVVVGDPQPFFETPGSAYVFVKPAGGWQDMTQSAQLMASDSDPGGLFGINVAIQGDVIVVSDYIQNQNHGKIYVYVKPAGGWSGVLTETAQLTASDDNVGYLLGRSLAMDSEGTIYSGAPLDGNGTVYVFVRPAGGWKTATQTAELTSSHGVLLEVGGNILAANGTTVVAGGPAWPSIFTGQFYGAAYIWEKPATGWVSASEEDALITAADKQTGDELADSAALYGDTLILGAPGINGGRGGGYAYTKPSGGWATTDVFSAKFTASDLQPKYALGASAAITGSFTLLGVGGYGTGSRLYEGAVDFYAPGPYDNHPQPDLLSPVWLIPDPQNQSLASFGQMIAAQGNLAVASGYDEQPLGGVYLFRVE